MNISVVIPNYNGMEIMKKNLPYVLAMLQEYKKGKKELIIVDDGSTKDDSVQFLQRFQEQYTSPDIPVTILFNMKNQGFSPTVNRGVSKAQGEVVILFNTDVRPEKDCLAPALRHFTNEKVFGVGMMDKSKEGGKTVLRGRGVGKFERGFLMHNAGQLDLTNTLWVSGGSGVFRKSIWDKLGGLNELYTPFYWEDVDLGYRGIKAGYMLVFEKESTVIHEHEEGAIKTLETKKKITSTAFRNQIFFMWLNITDPRLLFSHIVWLPYHVFRALIARDTILLSGLLQAIKTLPKILVSRNRTTKLFHLSDMQVVKDLSK
jgi:GT2 family glycosyltransferase